MAKAEEKPGKLTGRKVIWSPNTTRVAGEGFLREVGPMTKAVAKELARLYGGRFVSNG